MSKPRPYNQLLAERIRTLRTQSEMTQTDLAIATGIHRPNICRLESGKHTPSLGTLRRIAHALGVEISELVS